MRAAGAVFRFLVARRLVMPAVLVGINLASSFTAFKAGDYKRGIYFISSAVCIAMVAL